MSSTKSAALGSSRRTVSANLEAANSPSPAFLMKSSMAELSWGMAVPPASTTAAPYSETLILPVASWASSWAMFSFAAAAASLTGSRASPRPRAVSVMLPKLLAAA